MQPQPPNSRQSGPEAHPAPKDALHQMKPGGPITLVPMGFENPGPTVNLRGVEPNTAMHRGTSNPEQHGDFKSKNDHNPGFDGGHTFEHGVPTPVSKVPGRHSDVSKKVPPAMPGHFARHVEGH